MMDIIEKFKPLFYPESVAMFGATSDVRKWGFALFHNLLKGGFPGPMYPVNPKKEEVFGIKAYKRLDDAPGPVDLAIVTIPPENVMDAISQCVRKGVRAAIVNTAGFGETGEKGKALEEEIAATARDAGIVMIGPNSQGVMSTGARLFPQMMGVQPVGGRISMASQSGNIGGTLMGWGRKWNAPMGKFISAGNEATTTCADLIEYFGHDPDTTVASAYIEGLRDGQAFLRAVRKTAREKPLLILKGGRTAAGRGAARSHTGAIAGQEELFDAACRQAGAIMACSLEELFDLSAAFASLPLPRGNRVAVLTQGGGWGVLAADAAQALGLEVVQLPDKAISELDKILPDRWSKRNPVDLAAGGGRGVVEKCLEILLECENVDAVAMLGMGPAAILKWNMRDSPVHAPERILELSARADSIEEKITGFTMDSMRKSGKPVVCSSDVVGSPFEGESPAARMMRDAGLVMYSSPERCIRVLAALVLYANKRATLYG